MKTGRLLRNWPPARNIWSSLWRAPSRPQRISSPAKAAVRPICGKLGIAARNALEMLGVLLVPGVTGSCAEAAAKFLVGEQQGDPSVLALCREEDPDDPMQCMHDCSKCAGCGPLEIPDALKPRVPEV